MDKALCTFETILKKLMAPPNEERDSEKREDEIMAFSDSLFLKKYAIHNQLPEFFGFETPSDDSSSDSSDSEEDSEEEEDEEEKKVVKEKTFGEVIAEVKKLRKTVRLIDQSSITTINKYLLESSTENPYLGSTSVPSSPAGWISCKFCGFRFCPLSDVFILDDDPNKTKPHVTSTNGAADMLFFVVPHPSGKANKHALAKLYCRGCSTSVASIYNFRVQENRCNYTGIFYSFTKVVISNKDKVITNIKGWAKSFGCRHNRFF